MAHDVGEGSPHFKGEEVVFHKMFNGRSWEIKIEQNQKGRGTLWEELESD